MAMCVCDACTCIFVCIKVGKSVANVGMSVTVRAQTDRPVGMDAHARAHARTHARTHARKKGNMGGGDAQWCTPDTTEAIDARTRRALRQTCQTDPRLGNVPNLKVMPSFCSAHVSIS